MQRKKRQHKTKFNRLLNGQRDRERNVQQIENFVINKSSVKLTNEEIEYLNMGLNFALPPRKMPIDTIIADVETTLSYCETVEESYAIRNEVETAITNYNFKQAHRHYNNKGFANALKSLKQKQRENSIIITKADKGNKTVILDRDDYIRRVGAMLQNDAFVLVDRPEAKLNTWMREARSTVQSCNTIMELRERANVRQSNYQFPRLYALPKIHKPGELKFRPISSDIQSPNYKIAKWLCAKFKRFQQPRGFSVTNTYEFINKMRYYKFKQNEIMVSFDIESMYTNISVGEAEQSIKLWLESIGTSNKKVSEYMQLVHLCLNTCYFRFNNKVYKQVNSLAMGNPLSAFAANCFMSYFETRAKENYPDFPSIWFRYVDDTYIVIDKEKVDDFRNYLNGINGRIHFTCEIEQNNVLPFLDLKLTRVNDMIDFNIYRKDTTTDRCIPSTSYHSQRTKLSAFNSYCYRAVNVPLNEENYCNEVNKIYQIADVNGYSRKIVDTLLRKHKRKKDLRELTTLSDSYGDEFGDEALGCYAGGIFVDGLTVPLARIYRKHSIILSPNSTSYKMKTHLCSTKDKLDDSKKSGIYAVVCSDCDSVYIGQCCRACEKRFSEHYKSFFNKELGKSTPADHMLENEHKFAGFRLLKEVNNPRFLSAYENLYIYKTKRINMNIQQSQAVSPLYSFSCPLTSSEIFDNKF